METISTAFVRNILCERPREMHKGQAGRVLLIAGSKGMAGAAVLAVRGALYSGAGLVKAVVPEGLFNILQISVPEAMCKDRNEPDDDMLSWPDAIAIGPGIGVNRENHDLMMKIFRDFDGPVLVDADGINCLAEYGFPEDYSCNLVMTPHPGEADRLLRSLGLENCSHYGREKAAEILADTTGSILLLKGAGTVISAGKKGRIFINPTGNPGMATGGSGDVLTGIISALLAAGYIEADIMERVCAGAFIHGLAGDIAAENIGEYGMTSADIADAVSVAFREIAER